MGDELRYIQVELKDVIKRIDTDVRISCNYYRDEGDEYVVRDFPFTTNVDTVVQQLSAQRAFGGGDYEEAVDTALLNAVMEHDWSPSAKERLLFLVLDAPPHQENEAVLENLSSALIKGLGSNGILPWHSPDRFVIHFCRMAWQGEAQWEHISMPEAGLYPTTVHDNKQYFEIATKRIAEAKEI
jgi:hypothetical protein